MSKWIKRAVIALTTTLVLTCAIGAQEGYKVHLCKFYAVCEDNCPENRFYIMTTDQDGEAYFEEMKSEDTDYSGSKFLVITKDSKKNVVFTKEF